MIVLFVLLLGYHSDRTPETDCRDVCEVLDLYYVKAHPRCYCYDPVTKRIGVFS